MIDFSFCSRLTMVLSTHPIKATALSGMAAQIARPLASLATLPLLLAELGQSGLGVWMIALSLMALVALLNTGLSNSLVTLIARAGVENSDVGLRRLATAATLIAVITAAVVFSITLPVVFLLDWTALFNLDSDSLGNQTRWMMVVIVVLVSFGMLASVPRQIMFGRMHGYMSNILDIFGVIAGALALILCLLFGAPLWLLALSFMAPSSLIVMAGGLVYLKREGIPMYSRANLHRNTLRQLFNDSLRMLGYHGAYTVSSQSDILLVGLILGAPASAVYGVAQRVFSLPIMLGLSVNRAQWPALARADSAGDGYGLARMVRYTLMIVSLSATAVAAILAISYQPLLDVWLGDRLETDSSLLIGMVAWVLVATLVNTLDSVLRAQNKTAFLMRSMMYMAVLNIATTLILLNLIGNAGAIWGSVTAYTIALLVPYVIDLRKTMSVRYFRKKETCIG